MKAQTVEVRESTGRILCCTIFRTGGRKLLAKGHVLSEEDVRLLVNEGLGQVWVTELEDGEVGEDEAVSQAARETGCGCVEIRLAAGGRAMTRIGCHLERFLAPVEPGNLFLLSYKDEIPIVSAPGCFRSAKTNVVDLVLPPMLARYRISGWEVANLGHGGLLG